MSSGSSVPSMCRCSSACVAVAHWILVKHDVPGRALGAAGSLRGLGFNYAGQEHSCRRPLGGEVLEARLWEAGQESKHGLHVPTHLCGRCVMH